MIFKHFRDLQNTAFKDVLIIKGLTMRYVCSWQHPHTTSKMMGIKKKKKTHMEFASNVQRQSLGKKLPLPSSSADSMPSKLWTSRTQRKPTAKFCQDKVSQSFVIPASQESLSDILGQQVKKMDTPILQRISNSAFMYMFMHI